MTTIDAKQPSQVDDTWGFDPIRIRSSQTIEEIAAMNRELLIEQQANGEFIMMAPAGSEGSSRNLEIGYQLLAWTKQHGGKAFDSSAGFHLPDGSTLSPDASWIELERWNALSKEDRKKFAPICPDFVVELRSESDRLVTLQEKLQSYVDNGVRLGWLVDPLMKQVHIYRPSQVPEVITNPECISGEQILPGFILDLRPVWEEV